MSGALIETTLELWAASLRHIKARMRPLFTQARVAASAGLFLDGLLGDPLVDPGDPTHRRQARTATHPICPHHRVVGIAKRGRYGEGRIKRQGKAAISR
jgi:hypothetical protein